jgi:hypothetical protein
LSNYFAVHKRLKVNCASFLKVCARFGVRKQAPDLAVSRIIIFSAKAKKVEV